MIVVALHAERVAGDSRAIRWVVPAGTLPIGRIVTAPGELGVLIAEGTVRDGIIEHTAVWLWLCDGESWARWGSPVRSALSDALKDPGGWVVAAAPGDVLERVTTDILDGPVGDFVRSHGGSARACRLGEDAVEVALAGACEHCPAAGFTLRQRLVGALRERCPNVAEVHTGEAGRLTVRLAG